MIEIDESTLKDILKIENVSDYPQISGTLIPTAESVIATAVGESWLEKHAADAAVVHLTYMLIATWFNRPEGYGELTPGANFIISQLQAKALKKGDADGGND